MTGEQLRKAITDWLDESLPSVRWFHSFDPLQDRQPGFPDLVIVGRRGVLWFECKGPAEELSHNQTGWKWALLAAGQRWHLVRPAHWHNGFIKEAVRSIL